MNILRHYSKPGGGDPDDRFVEKAVDQLTAFGGDLTRIQVERLLPMWVHYRDLSPREVTAIMRRFPVELIDDDTPVLSPCRGIS